MPAELTGSQIAELTRETAARTLRLLAHDLEARAANLLELAHSTVSEEVRVRHLAKVDALRAAVSAVKEITVYGAR